MADGTKRAKSSKKNRKHGRNAPWCKGYAARRQCERNRIVRLARYLRRRPDDVGALAAFSRSWQVVHGRASTSSDLAGFNIKAAA